MIPDRPESDSAGALADRPVRHPRLAVVGVGLAVVTVVVALIAAGVAAFVVDRSDEPRPYLVVPAPEPVAPVALPDGRVAWAERSTGVVRAVQVDRGGDGPVSVVARVGEPLRTDGQRGLLGLAPREEDGTTVVYASWTRRADGRLVVGRLPVVVTPEGSGSPGAPEDLVWVGPVSTELANGGSLAWRGDQLLIGIGELEDPGAADDPTTPNGKVLALDPAGRPDQDPEVVVGGLHNPFALVVDGGRVWVVDNAPAGLPERLVGVGADGSIVTEDLADRLAPSGAALVEDGTLLVCSFLDGTVLRFSATDVGTGRDAGVAVGDTGWACASGVAAVGDAVVTTTLDEVQVFDRRSRR